MMISNILATGIGTIGCSITGILDYPVQNITLQNIGIEFIGGGTSELIDRNIPELEKEYPEYNMFGTLPSYGFYVRHANNIRFENFELKYDTADHRPAFKFEDVENLDLVDVEGEVEPNTSAFMLMDGVSNVLVTSCRPGREMKYFIDARNSTKIGIMNNDFTNITEVIRLGEGVTKDDIFLLSNMKRP